MQANKVVGVPKGFSLKERLKTAKQIKIAVAFATRGGWSEIEAEVMNPQKTVEIIVGLNAEITEPQLLDKWLAFSRERPDSFRVFVAPLNPMFHPKLLIVHESNDGGFAIVGSGNLTAAGQAKNVECSVLIDDSLLLNDLENWVNQLECFELSPQRISEYRAKYNAISKMRKKSSPSPKQSQPLGAGRPLADFLGLHWQNDQLKRDMVQYLSSPDGKEALESRIGAANRIRSLLHIPKFDFSKEEWEEFYNIPEFGWIRPTYRSSSQEVSRLRKAFRFLLSKPLTGARLRSVLLNGQSRHVRGAGKNVISKVLTAHSRHQWPLINERVVSAFKKYGYFVSQDAEGYLRFAEDMRRLLANGLPVDFWALDAFCEFKSRQKD